ncbi:hypothetical protein [Tissierella praeacuta]|uniref:hypothetical protein n=1 Tax=Tissierella praeacuta TaxID=43131 RepID=UPI00333ED39B
MLTKNDIAKKITGVEKKITRMIGSNYQLDFTEDTIYNNLEKAESWSMGGEFTVENKYEYYYLLKAYNVPVHHVDYSNEEELDILGATDCEKENEVLVAAETKLRITWEPQDIDFEEMGYYVVEMEYVEEE